MPFPGEIIRASDVGAWTAFTPTITASTNPTFSTSEGHYKKFGDTVHLLTNMVFLTAGVGTYAFTLPFASEQVNTEWVIGTVWFYDNPTTLVGVAMPNASGTTAQFRITSSNGAMSNTNPSAIVAGDALRLNLLYQAAS